MWMFTIELVPFTRNPAGAESFEVTFGKKVTPSPPGRTSIKETGAVISEMTVLSVTL